MDLSLLIGPNGSLVEGRVEQARTALGWSIDRTCNELAILIATKFIAGEMSFEVADTAMNWVHSYAYQIEGTVLPEPCWEIYLAFDAGEWRDPRDPPDTDPIVAYTRPRLQSILARAPRARA